MFLDVLLCVTLLLFAWLAVRDPDLYRAVGLFIAFGLLCALCWARLSAPDLALTEAALGAGLTGALFFTALGRISVERRRQRLAAYAPAFMLFIAFAVVLGYTIVRGMAGGVAFDLREAALDQVPNSGVRNPVTSVLLNFRAYDTMLELGVLLLAVIGVYALRPAGREGVEMKLVESALLGSVRTILSPVIVVLALWLLWAGEYRAGGAFQAGSLLGAAGVLQVLCGRPFRPGMHLLVFRAGIAIGFAVFLLLGTFTVGFEGVFLHFPLPYAKPLILVIETAAAASIGLILTALYAACAGWPEVSTVPVSDRKEARP